MEIKDYVRIIRRRFLELAFIFGFVVALYFVVSHNESQKYLATVNLRVGEQVSSSLNEPNILFLRNRQDLKGILSNKGPSSVYYEAAHHIRYKIEIAQSVNSFSELPEKQKKLFYRTKKRDGLHEIETRQENFKETLIGVNRLKAYLKKQKADVTLETIESKIADVCKQISVSDHPSEATNALTLNLKIEKVDISKWIVNEVAFFVADKFNELNSENAVSRMKQIDVFFDAPHRDDIERQYNEIVFLYRDYLKNPDPTYRGQLQRILTSKFQHKNFNDAFEVDHLRQNLKKIIEMGWRFNNARSFGETGNDSLKDKRSHLTDIQGKIKTLEQNQIDLDRKKMLTEMRYAEFSKEKFDEYLRSVESVQDLHAQLSEAQINLDSLQQNYTLQHPKVRDEMNRITKIKGIIRDLETRFRDDDRRQFNLKLREIDFQKVFNEKIIGNLKAEETQLKADVQKIEDMKIYLEVIENNHKRLLNQAESLTSELQGLKRIVEFQRIVHVERPASKSFLLPKTYTRQTFWLTVIAGIFISLGIIYVREHMDTRIKTEHDIRRHLNLPIISVIQKTTSSETLLSEVAYKEPFAENFNAASTLIHSAAKKLQIKSFLITSTLPKEGKTTIAINLSESLVHMGFRVLLIDADFRIPRIHEYLKIDNTLGLSTWISGRLSRNERAKSSLPLLLQKNKNSNLHVLTAGPVSEDPVELVTSEKLKLLIQRAKKYYDFIFVDSPPLYNVADSLTLATHTDANVFVVGSELVEQDQVTWAKHLLENVNSKILGVMLNYVRFSGRSYYYYYNGYKSYRARG